MHGLGKKKQAAWTQAPILATSYQTGAATSRLCASVSTSAAAVMVVPAQWGCCELRGERQRRFPVHCLQHVLPGHPSLNTPETRQAPRTVEKASKPAERSPGPREASGVSRVGRGRGVNDRGSTRREEGASGQEVQAE